MSAIAVLVESGFMVLVGLRGLRESRTKIGGTQQVFPPPQPRARKIKPKSVRTLHERSSKRSKFTFTASEPIMQPLGNLQCIIIGLASRRIIGGYPPDPSAALTRRYWSPIFCPLAFGLLSLDCLPGSLDCDWRS
jgi:hypothetical protein